MCQQVVVPNGVRCERDWRRVQVAGTIPFSAVVKLILAGIAFVVLACDSERLQTKGISPEQAEKGRQMRRRKNAN
jgi:hypothetical protein